MISVKKVLSYKVIKKKLAMVIFIGLLLILVGVWLIRLPLLFIISIDFPLILLRLVILLSSIIAFTYGYLLLSTMFNTTLEISEKGILYRQAYVSIYCKWEEIRGFKYLDSQLFLKCSNTVMVKGCFLGKIFRLVNYKIPIHLFIDSKFNRYDWDNEELLQVIRQFLPRVFNDISKMNGWVKES